MKNNSTQTKQAIIQYAFSDYINSQQTTLGKICWKGELWKAEHLSKKNEQKAFVGSFDKELLDVNNLKLLKKNDYDFYTKYYSTTLSLPTSNKDNILTQSQTDQMALEAIAAVESFFFKLANNNLPPDIVNQIQTLKKPQLNDIFSTILTTPISWLASASTTSLSKYLDHFLKLNNEPAIDEIYFKLSQPQIQAPKKNDELITSKTIITQDNINSATPDPQNTQTAQSTSFHSHDATQKNINLEWAFVNEVIHKITRQINNHPLELKTNNTDFITQMATNLAKLKYKLICNSSLIERHANEFVSLFTQDKTPNYSSFFIDLDERDYTSANLLKAFLKTKHSIELKEKKLLKKIQTASEQNTQATENIQTPNTPIPPTTALKSTRLNSQLSLQNNTALNTKNTQELLLLTQLFFKFSALNSNELPNPNNKQTSVIDFTIKSYNQLYYLGYKTLDQLKHGFLNTEHLNPKIIDAMPIPFWIGVLHHLTINSKIYQNIHKNIIETINQKNSNLSRQISVHEFEHLALIFSINSGEEANLKQTLKSKKHLNLLKAINTWNAFIPSVNAFNNLQYDIDKPKFKWLKNIIEQHSTQATDKKERLELFNNPSSINNLIEHWIANIQAKELAKEIKKTPTQKRKIKTI